MTNNSNGISIYITLDNKELETIRTFKYLGAIASDEGSTPEVVFRIAQTTAHHQLQGQTDAFPSHDYFLYACETWTITADTERRIQTLEMRCFHKVLGISYRDHVTSENVTAITGNVIGPYEDLLTSVKRLKLKWYGHVT